MHRGWCQGWPWGHTRVLLPPPRCLLTPGHGIPLCSSSRQEALESGPALELSVGNGASQSQDGVRQPACRRPPMKEGGGGQRRPGAACKPSPAIPGTPTGLLLFLARLGSEKVHRQQGSGCRRGRAARSTERKPTHPRLQCLSPASHSGLPRTRAEHPVDRAGAAFPSFPSQPSLFSLWLLFT